MPFLLPFTEQKNFLLNKSKPFQYEAAFYTLEYRMKKLFAELKSYRIEAIFAPLLKLSEAALELIVPLIVANIVDIGIKNNSGTNYILGQSLLLLLLGIVGLAFAVTAQYFAAKAAVGISANMRSRLFAKIQSFSFSDLDKLGTSTLITRMTSDINQVQTGINMGLRLILRAPIIVFGATIMAFTINVNAAMIFLCAIPLLFIVIYTIMYLTIPMYKKVQSNLDSVVNHTRENLTGVRVIRAFCREDIETKDYDESNYLLYKSQVVVGRISAMMNPATYVIINLAIIWLIYSGAIKVNSGILTQGQVIALYNYMLQILTELIKFANLIITITKAVASGNRIYSLYESEESKSNEHYDNLPFSDDNKVAISLDKVYFAYNEGNNNYALENISFDVLKGEHFGIIGGTGSGKSTLISLISNFYSATHGKVYIFGNDVSKYNVKSLRQNISVVLQKPVLFKGTIRENLMWGKKDATDAEMLNAIELAQANDIITNKQGGLDAVVEQGGKNFSGGQCQRLTIARSLVGKPSVLILDDSSSALDFATEAALRSSIASLKYNPTVITVSQRTSSVMHCDRILVLNDGKIESIGNHKYLLDNCELYKEIYDSQFDEEVALSE